jgi:hypothetical protein
MTRPMYRHPGPAAARLDINVPDQDEPAHEIDVARWIAQMRADLAETLGGIMLRGARPVSLTVLPTLLSGSPGRLVGWSLHETGGTNPFVIRFRNGGDSAQPLIACTTAAASGVDTRWFTSGISFTEGLFIELVTGGSLSTSVEGTVYIGAAE